jgi:hypothetical protein
MFFEYFITTVLSRSLPLYNTQWGLAAVIATAATTGVFLWRQHNRRAKRLPSPPTQTHQNEVYYEKQLQRFRARRDVATKNANIDPVMYSAEWYKNAVKEETDIEKRWKSNWVIENTPMGTVMMYYDVYRGGFVYNSQVSLPYKVLAAVAMKYAMQFYCYDFFMDENILGVPSPLAQVVDSLVVAPAAADAPHNKYKSVFMAAQKPQKNRPAPVASLKIKSVAPPLPPPTPPYRKITFVRSADALQVLKPPLPTEVNPALKMSYKDFKEKQTAVELPQTLFYPIEQPPSSPSSIWEEVAKDWPPQI